MSSPRPTGPADGISRRTLHRRRERGADRRILSPRHRAEQGTPHPAHRIASDGTPDFTDLPVWSAVEAFSFGTLSKCIERGAQGDLADVVANSLGVAKAGFPYRVRAMVYLRNRCAHHSRLWHHSVIDAGPTPNNVRKKAKRVAGQFGPRSVLDVVASLDDLLVRNKAANPVLPELVKQHDRDSAFWRGLSDPQIPVDHRA